MGENQSKESQGQEKGADPAEAKEIEKQAAAHKAAFDAAEAKKKELKTPPSLGHTLWRTCLLAKGALFLAIGAMHLLADKGGLEAMDFTFLESYPAPGKVSGLCIGGSALPSPDAEPIEMLLYHTTAILGCNLLFRAAVLISTSVQDIAQIAPMVSTYEAFATALTLMVQVTKPSGTGAEGSPDSAPPELMMIMMMFDFVCFLAVHGIIGAPSKSKSYSEYKAAPAVVAQPAAKPTSKPTAQATSNGGAKPAQKQKK